MKTMTSSTARSDQGPDTTLEDGRSELIGLLPKARLVYNPITSAQIIYQHGGGFGLYCGDEGYFVVQPNPTTGFVSIPVDYEDARKYAASYSCEYHFAKYHKCLESILKAHGVSL